MAVLSMARPWKHPATGIYYFRRGIPEDLRPFVNGEGPFGAAKWVAQRSLHTRDERKAKRLNIDVAAICDDYFSKLRAAKARAERLPLAAVPATEPNAPPESTSATTPARPSLRALAEALGHEIVARNAPAPGSPPSDAAFRLARSIPPGPWGDKSTPWVRHRYVLALSKRAHGPATAEESVSAPARAFLQARGVMPLTADEWEEFCDLARDAIDAALEELQRRHRGRLTTMAYREPGALPESGPRVSIKGLIDTWAKVRPQAAARSRTRSKYERRLREFSAFLRHDDAMAVTSQDLRRWRDHLAARGLEIRTINSDCIAIVKAIFKVAEGEGVLPSFPFTGSYALTGGSKKSGKRRPYEPDEAARVLLAARDEKDSPFLRWVPWLLAYTGARVGEVAQLRRENVKRRGDVHYLQITDDGDDKSVKTESSAREVPLHAAVINDGFLTFVEAVGAGQYLFAFDGADGYERRADKASQAYMRWLRKVVGITDRKIVSHSWRHRMEDELRDIDAPDDVAHAITGRTGGGSRRLYGRTGRPSLKTLARWMGKIPAVDLGPSGARIGAARLSTVSNSVNLPNRR